MGAIGSINDTFTYLLSGVDLYARIPISIDTTYQVEVSITDMETLFPCQPISLVCALSSFTFFVERMVQ